MNNVVDITYNLQVTKLKTFLSGVSTTSSMNFK